jgi:FKBP-type peptidyl-prolyl cis-trans isomerase FkpA
MCRFLKTTLLASIILVAACSSPEKETPATETEATAATSENDSDGAAEQLEWTTLDDGLEIADLVVGEGAEAAAGMNLQMHYTGWLYDETAPEGKGEKFDSSRDRGQPFGLTLGTGMVIKGWDEGIVGMKPGGRRMLKIPSNLGYGPNGRGPIPGGATMLFDVELVSIQ